MTITLCYSAYYTVEVPDIPIDDLDLCSIEKIISGHVKPPQDSELTYVGVDMDGVTHEWHI